MEIQQELTRKYIVNKDPEHAWCKYFNATSVLYPVIAKGKARRRLIQEFIDRRAQRGGGVLFFIVSMRHLTSKEGKGNTGRNCVV